jgi:diguanylate cyclase (GGDEF)-like protein/putative nucleotidyltransferase with HDIG domain
MVSSRAAAGAANFMSAPLDGLAAVGASLRTGTDMSGALHAVASTIAATLRFRTVVINVYRPAYDEFECVAVHGDAQARELLQGHFTRADEWQPLFQERFQRRGAYFVPAGSYDWDSTLAYIPPAESNDDPDAWQAEDGLFVALRSATGATLGVLSVDQPESGRRPSDGDLDALLAVAAQAGLVIEAAHHAEAASRHRAEVEHLLRVSRHLTGRASPAEVLREVCEGIREGLGFDRVAVLLADGPTGELNPAAVVGWPHEEVAAWGPWTASDLERVLDPALQRDGCSLMSRDDAHALVRPALRRLYSSRLNGRGPHAWDHHWLLVPFHGDDDRLLGVIWADDPADRLLPPPERLRALRAFANQAASALEAARGQEQLRFLAEHDPMTGLRNRRGLHHAIDAVLQRRAASLLVADVDSFKRINDELGYEVGDGVLKRVAAAIADACPPKGLAARLGGEEFALLLPGTDAAGARLAAEALRLAAASTADVPWGLTISVGLATSGGDLNSAEELLRSATRALFAAKRLGRDRCVVYDAGTLEPLIEAFGRDDGRAAHHLSAVMLLAETLDLRDAGTARHSQTVGRYARALAAELGLDPERVERMRIAGILHDIGKLGVADAVLHKPGRLTPEEWIEIRRHCEVGSRILTHAGLKDIAHWVLHHHERWDGEGYPRGLVAEEIPIEARILAVCDAYEAMTAVRPYRQQPLTAEAARDELVSHSGTQFDPRVVEAFLRILA